MVYFQTKNPNLGIFWKAYEYVEKVGIFYGQLEYISAIWYISWPFCNLVAILEYFPLFGILCQEISGYPGSLLIKLVFYCTHLIKIWNGFRLEKHILLHYILLYGHVKDHLGQQSWGTFSKHFSTFYSIGFFRAKGLVPTCNLNQPDPSWRLQFVHWHFGPCRLWLLPGCPTGIQLLQLLGHFQIPIK
jgi:hypothetical protein